MPGEPISFWKSIGGKEREIHCRNEFNELLLHRAVCEMRRRRSSTLDETDFDSAFRELLAPRSIDWVRQLIGTALLFGGGALVSIGGGNIPIGILAGITGVFIQYWPHWKRA